MKNNHPKIKKPYQKITLKDLDKLIFGDILNSETDDLLIEADKNENLKTVSK